jgi:hypothetical protein
MNEKAIQESCTMDKMLGKKVFTRLMKRRFEVFTMDEKLEK